MSQTDRLLAGLLWLLGVLCVAAVTHIIAIFALPDFAEKDPYARISELTKPAELTILPPARPGDNSLRLQIPRWRKQYAPSTFRKAVFACTPMSKATGC